MADFLSADWFRSMNEALEAVTPESASTWRVVFEWADGPSTLPHAMTLSSIERSVAITLGDHLAADALVTMSYVDAKSLFDGSLEPATALREGRFKLRGDTEAIVAMANALRSAVASA